MSIDATYNMKNTDITITKVTMILTALAIITAPFDELFVIEVGGLTLRFSLIFIMAACFCLLMGWRQRKEILVPVGSNLLISLLILNGVFSFINSSGSLMMQLGYQIWFALDVMLVLLCVNLFLKEKDKHLLFILWTGVFLAMAVICIIQLLLGIWGIPFYQEQYFGRLPRCDAFLSEPSYYACFVLPGWVTFAWLLEQREEYIFSRKAQWGIWLLFTVTLMFSTSRMGILMTAAWLVFRLMAVCFAQRSVRRDRLKVLAFLIVASVLALLMVWLIYAIANNELFAVKNAIPPAQEDFSDRIMDTAGSDTPRIEGMVWTLRAFWENHLWVGSSLGGVYAEVMHLAPENVWQVSNLCAELLVALGLPGFLVLVAYLLRLVQKSVVAGKSNKIVIAVLWGILWQLGILQFNNNGLRIYVWVNIALLSIYLPTKQLNLGVRKGS